MHEILEQAISEYANSMIRSAMRVGVNRADADDAVVVAKKRLYDIQHTIDYINPHRVRALCCAVARRAAIDIKRTQAAASRAESEYADVSGIAAYSNALSRGQREVETALVVHKALGMLEPLERQVAWRALAMEESMREIVEFLADNQIFWSRQNVHKFLKKVVIPKLRVILIALEGDKL